MVPRRRDPHGRPAACARRAAANHPDRRGRRTGLADPGDDGPSGWLWAAALLLALNPARAAFGVPRAGRSPRSVVGVAAAGAAIGGLAVCAAAAVGGPLLDALDVSEPSFRIAAGVVAALAGAGDLVRRPPRGRARAPRPARRARPGRDPRRGPSRRCSCWRSAPAPTGRPGDRRRDGGRRRAADRAGRPVAHGRPRGPSRSGGPAARQGPRSSPAGRSSSSPASWTSRPARETVPTGGATPRTRGAPRRVGRFRGVSRRRGRAG